MPKSPMSLMKVENAMITGQKMTGYAIGLRLMLSSHHFNPINSTSDNLQGLCKDVAMTQPTIICHPSATVKDSEMTKVEKWDAATTTTIDCHALGPCYP